MTRKSKHERVAFNLKRLKNPSRTNDLKWQLLASVVAATGERLSGFETGRKMRAEKGYRARSLERLAAAQWVRQTRLRERRQAAHLAKLLRRATRANDLPSLANPLFMRKLRRRLIGEVLRLIRQLSPDDVRIYHIVAAKWKIRASQLSSLTPAKLRESVRTNLTRAGIDRLSGWVIAFFHNEYDLTTDTYQPHFHVIAVGEKYRAFEALRSLKMFAGGKGKGVYRPIVVQGLANPARQISYLLKGYWLQTTANANENSGGTRRNDPRRIREPRHAQSILFLHQLRFSDLVWLHDIAIKKGRLVPKVRS